MPISKIYMICNAYESGFGHGVNNDGLTGDYYADPEHNEAYKIGYDAGVERSKAPTKDVKPAPKCGLCKDTGRYIEGGLSWQCYSCPGK